MSEHRRKPPQGRGRRAQQPPQPPQAPPGRRADPPHQATSRAYGAGPDRTAPGGYGGHRRGGQDDTVVGGPRPGGRAEARRAQRGGRRRASNAAAAGAAGAAAVGGRAAARERARAAQAATKKRFIDYPRSGKYGWRRWAPSWKQWLGTFTGFAALMMGLAGVGYAMVEIPEENPNAVSQQNVYLWNDGSRMVTAGGGKNRQSVDLGQIPDAMENAVIAAENDTFYEDSGIDPLGIARAAFNMALGGQTQSGSTITQQYVKNMFLTPDQTLKRKVRELFLSIKVDAEYSKDEILEGYLNTAYFGRGAYGIQAGAQAYYQKDASELTPSECAFMATLVNAPNLYDPYGGEVAGIEAQSAENNTVRAKKRWRWILKREVETGRMEASEMKEIRAKGFPKPKAPQKEAGLKGQIGYLVDLANKDILANSDNISKKQLSNGGYQIKTTFDKEKVKALEDTIKKVRKENLKPEERKEDKFVQFGGASVKPGDGAVVAVYGGYSAVEHWANNAEYSGAPVGSTFKPFVMAAALENGIRDPDLGEEQSEATRIPVSPETMYNGDSGVKLLEYDGDTWLNKDNKEWHTPNEGEKDYGEIDLMEAMRVSANTPFIQLGMDVGLDKVEDAAMAAGLDERGLVDTLTPSYSLGISAPSPVYLATGYATFAESGVQADPYFVTEVRDGAELKYRHEKKTEQAFDSSTADTITGMLQEVASSEGTGYRVPQILDRVSAGKTGTTDDNKTAWYAGYTPKLSTAIGMWRSDPENPGFKSMYDTAGKPEIHGGAFPAEIWATYMSKALEGTEPEPFPEMPDLDVEKYCAHKACPSPSPTPSPSESEETSPSPTAPSPSVPATPSPTESCSQWWGCETEGTTTGPGGDTGGMDGGTSDGGMDGGTTDGGTTGDPGGSEGTTGESDGGLFRGPEGDTGGRNEEE